MTFLLAEQQTTHKKLLEITPVATSGKFLEANSKAQELNTLVSYDYNLTVERYRVGQASLTAATYNHVASSLFRLLNIENPDPDIWRILQKGVLRGAEGFLLPEASEFFMMTHYLKMATLYKLEGLVDLGLILKTNWPHYGVYDREEMLRSDPISFCGSSRERYVVIDDTSLGALSVCRMRFAVPPYVNYILSDLFDIQGNPAKTLRQAQSARNSRRSIFK